MSNNSNISHSEMLVKTMSWYWWLRGMIAVITVMGNMLVILLILTRSSLRTTQNSFILSLAFADFLVGIVLFPLDFEFEFRYDDNINFYLNAVHDSVLYASMTNLCALTLDRYLYIVYPLKHIFLNKKSNVIKVLVFAWSSAFLVAFVNFIVHVFVNDSNISKWYHIILLLCFEGFSCVFLPIAYFRILYYTRRQQSQIKKQAKQLQHNYPNRRKTEQCKNDSRMMRVLGGIIGFFVITYLVYIYRAWSKYVLNKPKVDLTLSMTVFFLLHANSAINVFCYGLFKKEFRKEIAKLFCRSISRGETSSRCYVKVAKRTTEF